MLTCDPMNVSNRNQKASRIQTTVSVLGESVESLDAMAAASGVSRSRLIDLAIRRFVRWAGSMDPADLALIAEYEVAEPVSGFLRRYTPGTMAAVQAPNTIPTEAPPPPVQAVPQAPPPAPPPAPEPQPQAVPEAQRPKVLSSSAPRQRNSQGRYVTEAPPPARRPRGQVPTT